MPPGDDLPPLPSFPPGGDKPEGGKKGLKGPLLGALKLRPAPGSVVERLGTLQKRDLVFILAGLSVLCMAPVAEQFILGSDQPDAAMESGFDRRGGLFPDGAGLYENGTGGLSPGGLMGESGTDVITPLNVRDPSALIMGPSAASRPSAGAPAGPQASSSGAPPDWKNAITQAASRGAQAAVREAQLPSPGGKMSGALRGLAALSGSGAGPSLRLDPLSAAAVPNKAKETHSLAPVQSAPGFRGAAARSPMAGGSESLKAAGFRQADIMNKGASPSASLDAAARSSLPGGSGPSGAGAGEGSEGRSSPPNASKDNKSVTVGENLALLRAKLEMEKAVDLKWKKKSWKEFERQKLLEELLIKAAVEGIVAKGLFEPIGKSIADAFGGLAGGPKGMSCIVNGAIVSYTMDEWSKYGRQAAQNGGYIGTCRPWPGTTPDSAPGTSPSGAGTGASPAGSLPSRLPSPGALPAAAEGRQAAGGLEGSLSRLDGALGSASGEIASVDGRAWDRKGDWEALLEKVRQGQAALKKAKEGLDKALAGAETADRSLEDALGADEQALGLASQAALASRDALSRLSEGLKRNPVRHGISRDDFASAVAARFSAVDGAGAQQVESAGRSLAAGRQGAADSLKALSEASDSLASAGRTVADARGEYARISQRSTPEAERAINRVNEAMGALNDAVVAAGSARDRVARAVDLAREAVRLGESAHGDCARAVRDAGTPGPLGSELGRAWEGSPPNRGARDLEGRRIVAAVSDPALEASAAEAGSAQAGVSAADQRRGTLSAALDQASAALSAARRALTASRP